MTTGIIKTPGEMWIYNIPPWTFFLLTFLVIVLCLHAGLKLGSRYFSLRVKGEDSSISTITSGVLASATFIMAFTFSIVSNKYENRRGLVRKEATAIQTVYLRSSFLPDADRIKTKHLLVEYADLIMATARHPQPEIIATNKSKCDHLTRQIWDIAVRNIQTLLPNDIGAAYMESINTMINQLSVRYSVAAQSRVPDVLWQLLGLLVVLSMIAVGYLIGATETTRSNLIYILAFSFALILTLILVMDHTATNLIKVSQNPMEIAKAFMEEDMN